MRTSRALISAPALLGPLLALRHSSRRDALKLGCRQRTRKVRTLTLVPRVLRHLRPDRDVPAQRRGLTHRDEASRRRRRRRREESPLCRRTEDEKRKASEKSPLAQLPKNSHGGTLPLQHPVPPIVLVRLGLSSVPDGGGGVGVADVVVEPAGVDGQSVRESFERGEEFVPGEEALQAGEQTVSRVEVGDPGAESEAGREDDEEEGPFREVEEEPEGGDEEAEKESGEHFEGVVGGGVGDGGGGGGVRVTALLGQPGGVLGKGVLPLGISTGS